MKPPVPYICPPLADVGVFPAFLCVPCGEAAPNVVPPRLILSTSVSLCLCGEIAGFPQSSLGFTYISELYKQSRRPVVIHAFFILHFHSGTRHQIFLPLSQTNPLTLPYPHLVRSSAQGFVCLGLLFSSLITCLRRPEPRILSLAPLGRPLEFLQIPALLSGTLGNGGRGSWDSKVYRRINFDRTERRIRRKKRAQSFRPEP